MSGIHSDAAAGRLATPGRLEVLSAAGVGFLVACGLSQLMSSVVELLVVTPLKQAVDGDVALQFVLVAGVGLVALVLILTSVWIGGRVARRMTKDALLVPRVARAYAWILGVLGAFAVLMFWLMLLRMETAADRFPEFGKAMSPGVLGWGALALMFLDVLFAPFVGHAGVLREPRARRAARRRVR